MHLPHWLLALPALCLTGIASGQDSPTRPPEEVKLTLHGVDGKPLAEAAIRVIFETPDKLYFELVTTDSRGRFQTSTPEEFLTVKAGSLRLQRLAFSDDDDRVPTAYLGVKKIAFADLRKARAGGPVQLENPALAVAGRVVDRQGKPLAGLGVAIGAHERHSPINYRNMPARAVYDMTVLTDAEGRFAIHEFSEGRDNISVRIKSETYVMVGNSQVTVGDRNTKVVMGKASVVVGKILGVPAGNSVSLYPRLVPQDTIPGREYFEASRSQPNGEIRFSGCVGGTYDFHLMEKYFARGKPILVIENIKVVGGEECRDPKLAAIDISKHFRWIEVEIVGPAGEPVPRASVRTSRGSFHYSRKATAWVMIPAEGDGLTISADGFQAKQVEMAKANLRVVLSPSWRIELDVSNLPDLSASQVKIVLQEQVSDQAGRRSSSPIRATVFESAKESGVLPVSAAGKHKLQIYAMVSVPRPRKGFRSYGNSVPREEHIVLGSRDLVVDGSETSDKPIPVHIKLSEVQLAALKSFDAILKERKR